MPSTKATRPADMPPAPDAAPIDAASAWERVREHLEQNKARVAGQINSYASPIPACDAQFNYLLEQRGGITEELGRLEAARQKSLGQTDGKQALAEFLESSEFFDQEAARAIWEGAPA